jgi:phage baseplate assembly protein W
MADIYYIDISKVGRDLTGKRDISVLTNERAVTESIVNLLGTEPGRRLMNPEFGCSLESFLFEPLDPITAISIKLAIENALDRFEPRIESREVIVTPDEDNLLYTVDVLYSIKVIQSQQKLTFSLKQVR